MQKTSLKDLIKVSLYTGATAYGGPAMFTQIKKKFVTEKKWIDEKEFLDVLSFVQILPGATGILYTPYISCHYIPFLSVF